MKTKRKHDGQGYGYYKKHVGYMGAHQRTLKLWGPAKAYACVHCNMTAMDWAYDKTDPDEHTSGDEYWSSWPEFYMPLCKACHYRFDNQ